RRDCQRPQHGRYSRTDWVARRRFNTAQKNGRPSSVSAVCEPLHMSCFTSSTRCSHCHLQEAQGEADRGEAGSPFPQPVVSAEADRGWRGGSLCRSPELNGAMGKFVLITMANVAESRG